VLSGPPWHEHEVAAVTAVQSVTAVVELVLEQVLPVATQLARVGPQATSVLAIAQKELAKSAQYWPSGQQVSLHDCAPAEQATHPVFVHS
jgi:hypothetical protein